MHRMWPRAGLLALCLAMLLVGTAGTYEDDGFMFPLGVLTADEQQKYLKHFDRIEAQQPNGRFDAQTMNLHFEHPIVWELARHPKLLAHVQRLTGFSLDQLLIMSTTIFCKYQTATNVSAVVGWHQDLTYWELRPQQAWGLWLAIDDVIPESGALVYAAGMHTRGQLHHVESPDDDTNILMAKQSISPALLSGAPTATAVLRPGEAVFHGGWAPHMSTPNYSRRRRLGFLVNFITAETEVLPFSAAYAGEGNVEWRRPVQIMNTGFPPTVVREVQATASSAECARASHNPPLEVLRTTWGYDSWVYEPEQWEAQLAALAESGYAGVDADLSFVASIDSGRRWAALCAAHGLRFTPTVATATSAAGIDSFLVQDHIVSLEQMLQQAKTTNTSLLNVHGGHDGWEVTQATAYLKAALDLEDKYGVPVAHETHRRRLFHSPWREQQAPPRGSPRTPACLHTRLGSSAPVHASMRQCAPVCASVRQCAPACDSLRQPAITQPLARVRAILLEPKNQ